MIRDLPFYTLLYGGKVNILAAYRMILVNIASIINVFSASWKYKL